MLSLDDYLREAEIAHGHLCAGQVLGVRLAMLGLEKLGIEDPRGKDRKRLVTFVEIDRCATDAIAVVTGCRLGKRALKFRDWGKMAATFVDLASPLVEWAHVGSSPGGCPTQACLWLEWVRYRPLLQSHPHRRQRVVQSIGTLHASRNRKQKPAADAGLPRNGRRRLIHQAVGKSRSPRAKNFRDTKPTASSAPNAAKASISAAKFCAMGDCYAAPARANGITKCCKTMGSLFKAAVPIAFVAVVVAFSVLAQSGPGKSKQDVVEKLLPNGTVPKDLVIKPEQRDSIIKNLKLAQDKAHAQRAQRVAFLLAALGVEYETNRDYLIHVLSGCNYPEGRYDCDDVTGDYLIYLYEHGHREILAPLLKTSIGSYNAAASEGLGAFFGELVQKSPDKFLEAVGTFPLTTQKKACGFAGSSDGGGLGVEGLALVRKKFRVIGGEVAHRCLNEIEIANKPD